MQNWREPIEIIIQDNFSLRLGSKSGGSKEGGSKEGGSKRDPAELASDNNRSNTRLNPEPIEP